MPLDRAIGDIVCAWKVESDTRTDEASGDSGRSVCREAESAEQLAIQETVGNEPAVTL
jgi:hypothetical protein